MIDGSARGTLRERLGSPLDLSVAISILRQLAPVLDHLHRQGIVLREIDPAHLQITDEGRVILSGVEARVVDPDEESPAGPPVENPHYISPEQAQHRPLDHRADLYSLGVVLYEMLTGRAPFSGEPARLAQAHVREPVPPPRELNPALPLSVEAVVLKALAKRPDDRFQSAGELARALQAAAAPVATPAPSKAIPVMSGGSHPPPLEPITRLQPARDYTPFLIAGLVVLVCVGLMTGAIFLFANRGALAGAVSRGGGEAPTPLPSFAPLGTAPPQPSGTQAASSGPVTLSGTPVPRGQTLLRENFSDAKSGFGEDSSATVDRGYSNGEYSIAVKRVTDPQRGTAGWALLPGKTFGNFVTEVDCRMAERVTTGACGLALRAQDEDNWYKFSVDPGKGQANAHVLKQNIQTKQLLPWQASPAIKTGLATNHLAVVLNGTRFSFLVNGTEIAAFTDDTFKQGQIGLIANAFVEPVQAHFANLVVTEIRQ